MGLSLLPGWLDYEYVFSSILTVIPYVPRLVNGYCNRVGPGGGRLGVGLSYVLALWSVYCYNYLVVIRNS